MQWIVGIVVGIAAVVGVLLVTNGVFGGMTAQQAEPGATPARTVSVEQLRSEQRLANSLFEIVPGEVIAANDRSVELRNDGKRRHDVRLAIRNFDEQRTLQRHFWVVSATAWDARGTEFDAEATYAGSHDNRWWQVSPGGSVTGSFIVLTDPSAVGFSVSITYSEPNRTAASANFVWPYGR